MDESDNGLLRYEGEKIINTLEMLKEEVVKNRQLRFHLFNLSLTSTDQSQMTSNPISNATTKSSVE
jgi:hypothetical protein